MITRCLAIASCLVIGLGSRAAAEDPKPEALLRGLLNARSALTKGKLDIVVQIDVPHLVSPNPDVRLGVSFDGDKWFFEQSDVKYWSEAPDDKGLREKQKKLEAMGGDQRKGVAAGLGEWRRLHFRTIRDATGIYFYEPSFQAHLITPVQATENGIYLFDPRALGLDRYLHHGTTLDEILGGATSPDPKTKLTLVGEETVGGERCWRVRVERQEAVRELWIQGSNGFRLLRYSADYPLEKSVLTSSYDSKGLMLPSLVTIERSDENGNLNSRMTLRVLDQSFDEAVSPETFTLKNLGMPIGQMVTEQREHLNFLGYWDGDKLTPDFPVKRESFASSSKYYVLAIVVNAVFIGGFGLWYLARRRRRLK